MLSMHPCSEANAKAAVREAAAYLRSCGIRLPRFKVTTVPPEGPIPFIPIGGSSVEGFELNMGRYPTPYLRRWFAMHELGHILWNLHCPLRWRRFREEFGKPFPKNYYKVHKEQAWKTPLTKCKMRPDGEPSYYGALAGGQERFCELIGLMWAEGDFASNPPVDLAELWDCCWNEGLARMT